MLFYEPSAHLYQSDPLSTLISKHLAHPRPPRDLSGHLHVQNPGSFDVENAIQQGHWRQVATFARLSILSFEDPDPQSSAQQSLEIILQYWSLRFIALVRLRLHGLVEEEINRLWLVLQELCTGSLMDCDWIPFELHIIRARALRNFRSDTKGTIDRLWYILKFCKTKERDARGMQKRLMKQKQSLELDDQIKGLEALRYLWKDRKDRVRLLVAGYMADMKDFSSCVSVLEPMCKSSNPHVLSLISRLHLQAGSLSSSSKFIRLAKTKAEERISELNQSMEASEHTQQPESTESLKTELLSLKNLLVTNEALLLISVGKFEDAKETLLAFEKETRGFTNRENDENLTSLMNNLAITLFYDGQLEKPLEILESLLKEAPSQITSAESLIFNLTTFHELRREDSMKDKIRILTLVAQWAGEGISSSSLKLA